MSVLLEHLAPVAGFSRQDPLSESGNQKENHHRHPAGIHPGRVPGRLVRLGHPAVSTLLTLALIAASNYLYRAFYAIRGLSGPGERRAGLGARQCGHRHRDVPCEHAESDHDRRIPAW